MPSIKIDGKTKITGIIGNPIEHTCSPVMQNAAFSKAGLNWVYLPFLVREEREVGQALNGLKAIGCQGLNITMPYKRSVISFMNELTFQAQVAQAVNTVQFTDGKLIGYNTDGQGLVDSLREEASLELAGETVLLIGAGGAARSIAVALATAQAKEIIIVNRTLDRAKNLAGIISSNFSNTTIKTLLPGDEDIIEAFKVSRLIVNATSVGMLTNPGLPIDANEVSHRHVVYDVVYEPLETAFLKAARLRGAKTINGLAMLLYQGARSFTIWTGKPAPLKEMKEALKNLKTF